MSVSPLNSSKCWITIQLMSKKSGISDADYLEIRVLSMRPRNSSVELVEIQPKSKKSVITDVDLLKHRAMGMSQNSSVEFWRFERWAGTQAMGVAPRNSAAEFWKFERWARTRKFQMQNRNSSDGCDSEKSRCWVWKFELARTLEFYILHGNLSEWVGMAPRSSGVRFWEFERSMTSRNRGRWILRKTSGK